MIDTRDERPTPTAVAKNVAMYPEQWAVVEEVDQRHALNNTSAALRLIVEEYRRNRADRERETPNK